MRRAQVDLDALTATALRRIDTVERELRTISQDMTALGRGVAELTAQIRRLTQAAGPPGAAPTGSASDTSPSAGGAAADPPPGQRDWFAVADREAAECWLREAGEWAELILPWRGVKLTSIGCWLIHPDVVEELLALTAQREDAFAGPKPAAVSEWLTRWQPSGIDRIRTSLTACRDANAHDHAGQLYDAGRVSHASAATWWISHRELPAHQALRLSTIH
jgi:hypothetical protein